MINSKKLSLFRDGNSNSIGLTDISINTTQQNRLNNKSIRPTASVWTLVDDSNPLRVNPIRPTASVWTLVDDSNPLSVSPIRPTASIWTLVEDDNPL